MVKSIKMKGVADDKSFAGLFGNLSLSLLKANPGNTDSEIRRFIAKFGEHYRVDRVVLRKLTGDLTLATALHSWLRSNEIGFSAEFRMDQAPWISSKLFKHEVVRIGRLSDLPPHATPEREILENGKLRAMLLVPIVVNDKLYGAIDLASREEREWSDKEVHEVDLLGGTLISAHIRAQTITSLATNEARYRNLVEYSADSIWETNLDLEYTYTNDRLANILEYTVDELNALSLQQLLHPEDWLTVEELLPDLIERKAGWRQWTVRFRHKDGSYRYLESSANPVFDAEGNLCGYRGIDRDVTDSVTSREAIQRSEDKYHTLFESANDAIFLMDGEVFADCNKKTLEIFSYKKDDLIGRTPWEISPEYQSDGVTSKDFGRAMLRDAYAGVSRRFDWVHLQPDGKTIDMEVSLTPIELTHDGPRLLAVARDITQARQAQRELVRQSEFQRLLAELSTELATAPTTEIVAIINQIFERIGVQYELSSIAIWWYLGDETQRPAYRKAGWRRKQDVWPIPSDHMDRNDLPWLASQMRLSRAIQIDNIDDLPEKASTDRAALKRLGVFALLGFPAQVKEEVVGACYITMSQQRSWSTEEIQELRLIANTVSGAYARHWAVEAMLRREQDLIRSQKVARVGSFSLRYDTPQAEFSLDAKVEMSAEFRELHGIEAGQESAEVTISRIHPDDRERLLKVVGKGFTAGVPMAETFRVVRPDGTVLILEGRSEIDRDDKGLVKRWFGTAHDVTEQVESKKKIQSALVEIEKLKNQLQEENLYLRKEIKTAHNFGKIIGNGPQLKQALISVEKVAPTDMPVLILGETGTGKELIARAIYDLSKRKDRALITVNCAALSRDLIETEIFGHEKGAFTGAYSERKGRFELADGGTLFLDEIGELPVELQAKLLRVLQSGDFERLGGSRTLHVDVRLITATNRNLKRAVDEGKFRADLYYRISTFPIELPPLRERPEDIPELTEFFVQKHQKSMGKDIQSISARMIRYLTRQKWPGNIRELEGLIQRALISTTGSTLDYSERHETEAEPLVSLDTIPANEKTYLHNAQRNHILDVLEKTAWVIDGKRGAATLLGIAPSTLRSKMKRLGIKRPT